MAVNGGGCEIESGKAPQFRYKTRHVSKLSELKKGDHIRVPGSKGLLYDHHMLVTEVIDDKKIRVAHYTTTAEGSTDTAGAVGFLVSMALGSGSLGPVSEVCEDEQSFSEDQLSRLEVLTYPDSVSLLEDAVDRAWKKKGEKEYGILSNNCESFVNSCITGHKISLQGELAKHALIGAGVGGFVGGLLGVCACHVALKFFEDEKKPMDESKKRLVHVGACLGGAILGAVVGGYGGKAIHDYRYANEDEQ